MTNGHVSDIVNGHTSKESLTNGRKENLPNGHGPKEHNRSRSKTKSNLTEPSQPHQVDISQEISKAVHSLKSDLDRLSNRINSLEKTSKAVSKHKYLSFKNISPSLLAFLIIWPFVTHSVMRYWSNRK